MPQASKTFRIFVSSTFSDLKEERNALQKYVFPRLRELCMQHGCRFQAIDLRWGVSEEAALDQQTIKICLEEIKRCRKTTPRPNFIVLLGDRYGWRPLPYEIPAIEFEQVSTLTTDRSDHELLMRWYQCDDNAEPAVYCLQPRELDLSDAETDEHKHAARELEFAEWSETEGELRRILLAAVARLSFSKEQKLKYEASATEQEIGAGALNVDDAHEHVFCFFRTIRNLPADDSAKDFVDLRKNGDRFELDSEAHARQSALRDERLRRKLPENIFDYECEWNATRDSEMSARCKNVIEAITIRLAELTRERVQLTTEDFENLKGTKARAIEEGFNTPQDEAEEIESPISLAHIPELCADVFLSLAKVILEEVERIEGAAPLDKEIESHREFGEDRARIFVGRQTYVNDIREYLQSDAAHPLALYGESGSGKSALMARAIAAATKNQPSAVIVQRFIGATRGSSDGRALLESLCKELTEHYGEDEQSVPAEYQKLVNDFQKRLELSTQDKPLIIFLDALDQLSDNEHARNLAWLPNKLPPHVHLIVSTLAGECLSHLKRKLPSDNVLELEPMPAAEGDELLKLWMADVGRRLQPAQHESILKAFAVKGLPLYLKLVSEEARRWKSDSQPVTFPSDIPDMIRVLLKRLADEANHGRVLVSHSLGYLSAARHGLTEDELIDVLSDDENVLKEFRRRSPKSPDTDRLPIVIWSRLYFDLEPYLAERDASGANVVVFYHRQLVEVAKAEFLANESDLQERHRRLATYFNDEAKPKGSSVWIDQQRRGLSELPFHLAGAGQQERLFEVLTDILYLDSRCASCDVYALVEDYALSEGDRDGPLEQYQDFILKHVQRLTAMRGTLFTLLYHEGFPVARAAIADLISRRLWQRPWLRTTPVALPPLKETISAMREKVELETHYRFGVHSSALELAPDRALAFYVKRLGKIGMVDVAAARDLQQVITVRTLRPLSLHCSADASRLIVAYENGEADALKLSYDEDGAVSGQELLETFSYLVPEFEAPVMTWDGQTLWYQTAPDTLVALEMSESRLISAKVSLHEHSSGELSGIVVTPDGLVATMRHESDTVILSIEGRRVIAVSSYGGADVACICLCNAGQIAIAFTDQQLIVFGAGEQIMRSHQTSVAALPFSMVYADDSIIWCSDKGTLHAWTFGPAAVNRYIGTRDLDDDGVVFVKTDVIVARRLAMRGHTLLGVTEGAAFSFVISQSGAPPPPNLQVVFRGDGDEWHAIQKREAELWLLDNTRATCLVKTTDLRYEFGVDGTNHLLAASPTGGGLLVNLLNHEVRRVPNIPLGIVSIAGDPKGGFWMTDRLGALFFTFTDALCRKITDVKVESPGKCQLQCYANLLIWYGVCQHQSDFVDTLVFYRPLELIRGEFAPLSKRFFAKSEGRLQTLAYDADHKQLLTFFDGGARFRCNVKLGSLMDFAENREREYELDGVNGRIIAARITSRDSGLYLLSIRGDLFCLKAETFGVQAVLSPSIPLTAMAVDLTQNTAPLLIQGGASLVSCSLEL